MTKYGLTTAFLAIRFKPFIINHIHTRPLFSALGELGIISKM